MACKQTLSVRRSRAALIEKLGAVCKRCGEANTDKLEFDHINGRDYEPCKLSSSSRMARYKREAERGELRLLCGDCNKAVRKTNDNGQFVPTASTVEKTVEILLPEESSENPF